MGRGKRAAAARVAPRSAPRSAAEAGPARLKQLKRLKRFGKYDWPVEGYVAPRLDGLPGPVLEGVSKEEAALVERIRAVLSDDLRKPDYQGNENPVAGHCYVASEVFYHLMGGKEAGWKPVGMQFEGGPHWWLEHRDGRRVDPTADQFARPVPYAEGRGQGFLTKGPSERAQVALERMGVDPAPYLP